jgi:hypothetical protein
VREHATHGPGLLARLLIGGVDHLPWPAELLLLGARIYAGYTIASAGLDKLPVPNSFNNWDLTTHPLERQADRTWSATFVLGEPGPITFKFAANGSWDVNLGDDDPGTAGFPSPAPASSGERTSRRTSPLRTRSASPSTLTPGPTAWSPSKAARTSPSFHEQGHA